MSLVEMNANANQSCFLLSVAAAYYNGPAAVCSIPDQFKSAKGSNRRTLHFTLVLIKKFDYNFLPA